MNRPSRPGPDPAATPSRLVVDVRTPAEFGTTHIAGAVNLPLAELRRRPDLLQNRAGEQEILLVCATGSRAGMAREVLARLGMDRLRVLEGGMEGWSAAGEPVVRGDRRTLSLDRQVRITAGGLVLLGTSLGAVSSAWFLALPAFLGAGLVYSGISDSCGLARLLAWMPWNGMAQPRSAPDV